METPTLLNYLHQLRKKGLSHVPITHHARQILRELYTRGSARRPHHTTPAQTNTTTINSSGNTPSEKIATLATSALTWPPLKKLQSLRDTLVFSTGDPSADLMIVGDAPGFHDEQQQQPFAGPTGEKLNQILTAMGLSRPQVYLSNICKFRPATKNQTTNNRPPSPEEMATSLPILKEEISIVKPRVIVALGASTAHGLLQASGKINELRNSWHQFQGIPLRVSLHPSYLLSPSEGLNEKRKVWEDMLATMEKLKLPISEKQRNYFL